MSSLCQNPSQFGHGHKWQETTEEGEQREEQAEGSNQNRHVGEFRRVVVPRTSGVVVGKARHDDDEALEPHADVHEDTDDEHHPDVGTHLLEPEDLRR